MNKTAIFLSVFISTVLSLGIGSLVFNKTTSSEKSIHETALERIKRTGVLRCGYNAWPPFFVLDPNTRELSGISKDFSDEIIALAGWKIEYIDIPTGGDVEGLKTGKIDAMCGAGPWYMAAIKEISFTRPYDYAGAYIYVNENENRFSQPEDLNSPDITFTGMDGDMSADLVQRFYPRAKLDTMPGTTDLAQMLLNVTTNKADAVVVDPISASNFNSENKTKLRRLFPDKPIIVYGAGFSVKKDEHALFETLNSLTEMAINMDIPRTIVKKYDPDQSMFLLPAKSYQ